MKRKSIAAIATCHNRKDKTLASLEALFKQRLPDDVELNIYLVDDASTDGTAEAVAQTYPQVKTIPGNGSLFWNGGMRVAFREAEKADPDYYLWFNDDTKLYPDAVAKLLSTYQNLGDRASAKNILVGSTCDPDTGKLTYGGMVRSTWWHPLKFRLLPPSQEPQPCHTMNGNCVLIPRSVAEVVGNLDPNFIHSSGDMDYGLRVRQQGGQVWLAPGYVGTCSTNSPDNNIWENQNLNFAQRLKKVSQPKGLPVGEWKVFAQRHAGPLWPFYWGLPYIRLLLAAVFGEKMGSQING
ncbi:glycosyltransferase family 2 protein [Phormidium sp. CCY1219]|uniref:glycosyltransferase family 2 protein n=1 Tax=Phormidium sp. CCY1219 TaxID=2886104 RepID=UPI002D1E5750|nr:glycosyltransferase family 2 protein [Phormidium sp. CCY1219]MEB3829838.1 glycosyltransferase family 2 protein [Phormidium sp. CCY1219]